MHVQFARGTDRLLPRVVVDHVVCLQCGALGLCHAPISARGHMNMRAGEQMLLL